ncbi:polysaccharide biosynthesis/export family protein [Tritonibacter multivorans]|nr:polysaccharide biosynthesis/export family protein [Tritonibacter multivorans]
MAAILLLTASIASANNFVIRSGDLLRVEVLEDTTINREVLVAPDGRISLPLAGNVSVSGITIPQAQARIRTQLASSFATEPTVVVSLLRLREPTQSSLAEPLSIFVLGEVNNPGVVAVEPGATLLQALAVAGGVTDFAAVKRIQLRRVVNGREELFYLNYQNVLDGQIGLGLSKMVEGDLIVVPARRLFE